MEPLVSVVIPVYKTEKYVVKSVNSILTQSYKNTEIIIVDDGSPDSCPKICDDLQKSDNRIIVIHKENGGLSSARNTGIDAANGKYVFFLDSDDTLYADAVSDMVKIAEEENSDAVIPDSYYKVFETDDRTVKAYHFTEKDFSCDPKVFALNVLIGKGRASRSTAVLYSMKCIKENNLRFPLGKISEDFFFNLDFLAVAGKISVYKKPSLYNLKRDGSLSASYHKGFFDTIPVSLREAAKLDGASDARVFFQVVLPMSKPILVYTIISSFMVPWTDFVMAKMILNSGVSADWTVAIGLYNMLQKTLINNYFALFCAGGVLVSIPISILFVIMQKFYVEGITSGADKG